MSQIIVSMSRLLLADHLLKDRIGHHLGYNLLLADAARRGGRDAVLLTHREFDRKLAQGHRVDRIFRNDWRSVPHPLAASFPRGMEILDLISGRRFANDLQRGLPVEKMRRGDLILAQMLAPRHLECWLNWYEGLRGRSAPDLVFHLGYGAERFGGHAGVKAAWKRVRGGGVAKRVHFISDSESLADEYGGILCADVAVLPHVVDPDIKTTDRERRDGPIHFVSLGNARLEKGFVDLVAALSLVSPDLLGRSVRFTIQCHQADAGSQEALNRLVKKDMPAVHLLHQDLGRREYLDLLASADVVLLPYHLDHYARRTSGVFCEALVAGKPVITTEGSWMSGEILRAGGGWLVPERNPERLAGAIASAITEISPMAKGCCDRSSEYQVQFSADNFIKRLEEIAIHDHEVI
jgi:glycosyltransferase involved in cell wall biosynthesis